MSTRELGRRGEALAAAYLARQGLMIRAANLLAEARRIPGMAGNSSVTPDWSVVAQRIREEATDDWNDQVAVDRFVKKGGRFIRGSARFIAPGRLSVDGTTVEAPKIAINAGTVPVIPPIPGLSDVHYWTNHHAIETKVIPATLTILGGGPIGLELGQMFGRFGVKVTVVEAGERILGPEEPESSALLTEVFEREGIVVRTGAAAEKVSMDGGDIALSLSDGSTVRGEKLLVAVGRRAPLAELNAAAIGVAADVCQVQANVLASNNFQSPGVCTSISHHAWLTAFDETARQVKSPDAVP